MTSGDDGRPAMAPAFVRDSEALLRAYALAAEAHRGQELRGSESPYLAHPLGVAERLSEAGYGVHVQIAAVLHDVVEDSDLTLGDVTEQFGVRVGELVGLLTEDESIPDWEERKRVLRDQVAAAGEEAAAIYAADKASNLRDARTLYAKAGERAGERFEVPLDERVRAWRDDFEMLWREFPDLEPVAEVGAQLGALERDRVLVRGAA